MDHPPFFSPKFFYTFANHQPAVTVEPGDRLKVTCPDSDNAFADGTELSPGQRQSNPGGDLFPGNPMAGPIAIRDASPGDTVTVRIDNIELDRDYGQTLLGPGHGVLHRRELGDTPPRHLYRWRLDTPAGTATMDNPIGGRELTVPLAPFIGCIGVCPPWGQAITTLRCGPHGGNMDLPMIRSGATLHLPVFHDAGLVMLGDIHAAQGHGEIVGGGIETSGQVACTFGLIQHQTIPAPRIETDPDLTAIGVAGDLPGAIRLAYAHLIDWLATTPDPLNRWDAYQLVSQCATVTVGNLGESPACAAATIRREHLR